MEDKTKFKGRFKSDELRAKAIFQQIKGEKILEIGAYEGFCHGLLVEYCKDKEIQVLDPSIDLDKNPADLGGKFDTIVAAEVVEHLENPIQFVRYCARHLNPGGRLILSSPNSIGLQYILNEAWCVYDYEEYRGHTQAFTMDMLKRIMQDEGLKIIAEERLNAFWLRSPLKYFTAIFKKFRPDLLIVGEKQCNTKENQSKS